MIYVDMTTTPPKPSLTAFLVIKGRQYHLASSGGHFELFLQQWQENAREIDTAFASSDDAKAVAKDESQGLTKDWPNWIHHRNLALARKDEQCKPKP